MAEPLLRPPHILLVTASYYRHITDLMKAGALARLAEVGATIEEVEVTGAFEIPAAVSLADAAGGLNGRPFDGYVTLGCVIRGETSHYDLICNETARALQDLGVRRHLPIGFGVLTVENERQALERARPEGKNKGAEAADACLAIWRLKRRFSQPLPVDRANTR